MLAQTETIVWCYMNRLRPEGGREGCCIWRKLVGLSRDFYILCDRRHTSCRLQELVQLMAPINHLCEPGRSSGSFKHTKKGLPFLDKISHRSLRVITENLTNAPRSPGQTEKIPISNFQLIFSCLPHFSPNETTVSGLSASPKTWLGPFTFADTGIIDQSQWIEIREEITWTLVDLEIHLPIVFAQALNLSDLLNQEEGTKNCSKMAADSAPEWNVV